MLKITSLIVGFVACSALVFCEEIDLSQYEKSLYSEHGEDGILSKLFQIVQPTAQYCVELGAADGLTGSNTYLFRKQGWSSLLLDRKHESPSINLYKEFITAENINQLLEKHQVPTDFDLLSINLDYNDFYIWQAIDETYEPAVVVIRYNATHLPSEDKVVEYHPYYCGDGRNYFGASILAMFNLARTKGYSLVYAESHGENLFFVRDELFQKKKTNFKNINDVSALYRPPYGKGYDQDLKNWEYLQSTELLK